MRVILFIIGIALSINGLYLSATTVMGVGEAVIITIGICFILWSSFYDAAKKKGFLRFLKRLFVFAMTVIVLYSGAIFIYGNMDTATYSDEEYVIVLGAGLYGEKPSPVLVNRLDKTVEYMNNNQNATAIVSGGQGNGESITEALAMERYLISKGISANRIIKEEQSTSTYENFEYSKNYIDGNVVFITNDFHVLRSMQMAKMNGIDARHIGAPTPLSIIPVSCVRELLAQLAVIRYI